MAILGKQLLDLVVEYQAAVESRGESARRLGGVPAGREPEEIAADYEAALRELLT